MNNFLLEKFSADNRNQASALFTFLEKNLDVRAGPRGQRPETGIYSIRIYPNDINDKNNLLNKVETLVKSKDAEKEGITYVKTAQRLHSGKYPSVIVNFNSFTLAIVVAVGSNIGETFEKELTIKMSNLVLGEEEDEIAAAALEALSKVDKQIKISNILSIVPRTGSTKRGANVTPEETGKIIADIIIKMKNGKDRYISLKNQTGTNVAQFGCSGVINSDFSVNTTSEKWKKWIAPLGLEPSKIKAGLESYIAKKPPSFDTEITLSKKLKPGSSAYKLLQSMWGTGYIYLREKGKEFEAFNVDDDYLANTLLKNVQITKIAYPSPARKTTEIYLKTEGANYKLRLRNKNNPNDVRPTIIQLEKTK